METLREKYIPEGVGVADYAYNTSRSVQAYTEDGDLIYYDKAPESDYKADFNIINEVENSRQTIETDQVGLQISAGYRFIPSLKFDVNFSYNISHTDDQTWYGEDSHYITVMKHIVNHEKWAFQDIHAGDLDPQKAVCLTGGELKLRNSTNKSYNVRGTLAFNKMLTEEQNLSATLIGEVNQSKYTGFRITKRNYLEDRGMVFDSWDPKKWTGFTEWAASAEAQGSMDHDLTRKIGAILSVSWAWENTYILNGNMRMDWSNKFGDRSNEKFYLSGQFPGRWICTKIFCTE